MNGNIKSLFSLAYNIDGAGTNRFTAGYESGLSSVSREFIPTAYPLLNDIVARHSPVITYGEPELEGPRFSPERDLIDMLVPEAFPAPVYYAAVLMHELTHWTMLKGRAHRKTDSQGDEEIVAEIGASMLMAHVGEWETVREDTAGYIHGWMHPDIDDRDRFIAMLIGEPLPEPTFPSEAEFTKRFNRAVRRANRAVNFLLKG